MEINRGIVLFGAGIQGNSDFLNATNMNIPVKAFVDKEADKKRLYRGIDVILPEKAYEVYRESDWIISINSRVEKETIGRELIKRNINFYRCLEDYCVGIIDHDIAVEKYGDTGYSFSIASNYIDKNPLIYSFGVGYNWSFEKEIYNKFGGQIYMFDPSPNVVKIMMGELKLPSGIYFEELGLSDMDSLKQFHKPIPNSEDDYSELKCPWTENEVVELQTKRLSTIMRNKNHVHLNLLKIDIEGSEFVALPDIMESNLDIDQICVETHARVFPNSIEIMKNLKKLLNEKGYLLICNDIYEQTYINKNLVN